MAGIEARGGYDYRTARRSLNLMMLEWQNRGYNLWTIRNTAIPLVAGQSEYDLDSAHLDIVEGFLRTNAGDATRQSDLNMRRVSASDYAQQTNKLLSGRPTQFYVERKTDNISVHFWPVPDGSQVYQFGYYYMDRIEDAGRSGANTVDVPDRFLPCLTAGLAYHIATKIPEAAARVVPLKQMYEEQWTLASEAARDKSDFRITPWVGRV